MDASHDAMSDRASQRLGSHGILASAPRLDRWLHLVLVVLVVTSTLRYVSRHGLGPSGELVLAGAGVFISVYLARPLVRGRAWWPTVWVAGATLVWAALTLAAPSFAWTAVPLAFAALEVLAFRYAVWTVVLLTALASIGWLRILDGFDPTVVAGPIGIALVTVLAYRTLEQEFMKRQRLLEELVEAHDELAVVQRRTGALAERARLSREIHDSVGQGLSSINLLLQAAEQEWARRPDVARSHVKTAATSARSGLDEVRRVVRDLAPVELEGADPVGALSISLSSIAARAKTSVRIQVRIHGVPTTVPVDIAGALIRTARGAVANVVEHSAASNAVISLTYHPDEVLLDVHDDGTGFDQQRSRTPGLRGRGLIGIAQRAEDLGGHLTIESAPGEGTTLSVAFPLEAGEHG